MKCLLCESNNVLIKETHSKKELVVLWKNIYPNIDHELKLNTVLLYQCKNCSLMFFDPVLAGGDKFYSELAKLDWYYDHPGKTEYDYVQKFIKDGDQILDIGSGKGVLFTKIKKKVFYTGLEINSKAVEQAKNSNINVKHEYLSEHAVTNTTTYDVVCLFQVLEHLTELDSFLKSVQHTLKNKGLFIIAVPNNDGFLSNTPNSIFNLPPHHTILWTEKSLRFMAKKYDFEIVEIEREILQNVHREIAYKSYIVSIFRKLFLLPKLYIDGSSLSQKISTIVDRFYGGRIFEKLLMPIVRRKQKFGQSIIITLQKNKFS